MPTDRRAHLDASLDGDRSTPRDYRDGLTEEQPRMRLVPSTTTLLGLVEHATFFEGVWFDEAIAGRSRASTPDRSFDLRRADLPPGAA